MPTDRPAHRRLYDISEVSCPDSCNRPPEEKGCHFRMGPDRFTCTKCQLRIWRNFMGYELSPTDLEEMLHGDKVTSTERTLTRKRDGQETTLRGRLMFNEEYKVRLAPKIKSRLATEETCPKCGAAKLQLITSIDGSKWYGCSGYPECRFTRTYLPHTFKPTTPGGHLGKSDSTTPKSSGKGRDETGDDGQKHAAMLKLQRANQPQKTSYQSRTGTDNPSGAVAAQSGATQPSPQPVPEGISEQRPSPEKYRRIPRFILKMLHLTSAPAIAPPEPRRVS